MNNLVSVVITCYNHDKFIKQCIESIYSQTYRNIELYIFDDGSKDNSFNIIQELSSISPFENTFIFQHANMGLVKTRNRSLELINGEFVLFVDSDNYLEDNYIYSLLEQALNDELDIVYTNVINLQSGETLVSAREFNLEKLYLDNYIESCSLIRVSKIKDITYDVNLNYKKLEDYDFFLSIINQNHAKAGPCYKTRLNYRVLDDSMSDRNNMVKHYDSYLYILFKNYSFHPSFTKNAVFEHIKRLDIESSLDNESIIIFGVTNDDEEIQLVKKPVLKKGEISFSSEYRLKEIKIFPSNIPIFFKDFTLRIGNDEILNACISNGIIEEQMIIFHSFYPVVKYNVSDLNQSFFTLTYERFEIRDITSNQYIGSQLAYRSFQNFEEKNCLSLENSKLRNENENLDKINKELKEEIDKLKNSKRW